MGLWRMGHDWATNINIDLLITDGDVAKFMQTAKRFDDVYQSSLILKYFFLIHLFDKYFKMSFGMLSKSLDTETATVNETGVTLSLWCFYPIWGGEQKRKKIALLLRINWRGHRMKEGDKTGDYWVIQVRGLAWTNVIAVEVVRNGWILGEFWK